MHWTEAVVAGQVPATPVPSQKAEMQLRAKMSFRLRAVILESYLCIQVFTPRLVYIFL